VAQEQSTALALPEVAKAANIDLDAWATMLQLYAGNKPESIVLVARYCRARKLDPLRKPVHIVPMYVEDKSTGRKSTIDVIMPGIQELRVTAARTGELAGQDEPEFGPDIDVQIILNDKVKEPKLVTVPQWCKVTVYRMVCSNDKTGEKTRVAYTSKEYFDEVVARTREGVINSMWQKRSRGQLVKCATAAALRSAFPEEAGGEMTMEEMAGKTIGSDAIDTDFSVVQESPSDIPDPVDLGTAADVAAESQASSADKTPPPERKPEQAPPEKKTGGYTRTNASDPSNFKIEVTDGARRMIDGMMTARGLTDTDILAHFKADVTMGSINPVLAWLREQPEKSS
jgi:phage recombination protein Bet